MSRPSPPRDARGGLAAAVSGPDGAAGGGSGGGASPVEAAGAAAGAAVEPPPSSPAPAPLLTLEDVAPYIAQAGHVQVAGVLRLAQVMRSLRTDERVWRAISRAELPVGLWRHVHRCACVM